MACARRTRTAALQGVLVLVSAVVDGDAQARPPATIRIVGAGKPCPSPAALGSALREFLPHTTMLTGTRGRRAPVVEIEDRGASYRLQVAGVQRDFVDADRRCRERARAAAVFITLTVDPPSAGRAATALALATPARARRPGTRIATSLPSTASVTTAATDALEAGAVPPAPGAVPATDRKSDPKPLQTAPPTDPKPLQKVRETGLRETAPPTDPKPLQAVPSTELKATDPKPLPATPTPAAPGAPSEDRASPSAPATETATPDALAAPSSPATPPAVVKNRWFGRLRVEIELGVRFEMAPPTEATTTLLSGGGGLRVVVGGDHLGLSVGAAGLSPPNETLSFGSARLWRVPLDVSVRGSVRRGRFEVAGEAGLLITVLVVAGEGFSTSNSVVRGDAGLRTGGSLRVWASERVAPFIALDAALSPTTYPLTDDGGRPLGTTPRLWLGGAVGLVVALR